MKTCPKCSEDKEDALYSKNKNKKDGLALYCKSCFKEMNKKYHTKNKELRNQVSKEWRGNNDSKRATYAKLYYAKNKKKVNAYQRIMKKKNPEMEIIRQAKYRNKPVNKQKKRDYAKWYRKNGTAMRIFKRNEQFSIMDSDVSFFQTLAMCNA